MRRLLVLLAASALASPAVAQHQQHGQQQPTAEDPHAGHAMPAEQQPDPHAGHQMPQQPEDPHAGHVMPEQPDPHAGHAMPAAPQQPDPHAGHAMPTAPQQPDPHAGHAMPPAPQQGDPHAGHDMTVTAVDPPVAPPPPEAFTGPEHAADLYYGDTAMARSRLEMYRMHGAIPAYRLFIERLEARVREGQGGYLLDAQAWYGGDIDKLWLKAEADGEFGEPFEGAELQALWSHAIGPWFDLQTGVRYDPRRGSDRGYLVAGVQGLAPYWIEIEAAAFLSDQGDITARFEAEHDVRITNQWTLQPRAELALALQDVPRERIGAGLSQIAVGARLRYQVTPLFEPYVGVEYERAFGDTRGFRRLADEEHGGFSLLAGVRTWF